MSSIEPQFHAQASQLVDAVSARNRRHRRILFALFGLVLAGIGAAYGGWRVFLAQRYVSTDNAYTAAETAQVTPAIGGTVREVRVTDTQPVRRGEVLVVLDDVDARLALAQADAELGRAVRRVRGYVANDSNLAALMAARSSDEDRSAAQVAAAVSDLERARLDLQRRDALAVSGAVSGDELSRARNAFETASANLDAARAAAAQSHSSRLAAAGQRAANAVLIADSTEQTNPEVALARARREQARVDLERTVIRAPVDGVVARRTVQVGQQVQPGATLLAVVPVAQMHVDANFKEGQLDRVRIGQAVEVTSDLYGENVIYHGQVAGLSGGTGAAFATIPAQNATGNWIKVVQRVPVRIRLDAAELATHPLEVGLSMVATVDTRGQR